MNQRMKILIDEYNSHCKKGMTQTNQEICKNIAMELMALHSIKDYMQEAEPETKAEFCFKGCTNEIDVEFDRILKTGTTEHMHLLSEILSKHFLYLKMNYPIIFKNALEEMKKI